MKPESQYETLPWFVYHPDPVASGSVIQSEKACAACGKARGYIYVGPVYGREDLDDSLCPWCIAEGTAHAKFGAQFMDREFVGGGIWDAVPQAVVEEVTQRTPGFASWQQERWFAHCGDAGIFLGPVGRAELEALGQELVTTILRESGVAGADWGYYLSSMDKDHGPVTAYVFRCRHCGILGGYSDCH